MVRFIKVLTVLYLVLLTFFLLHPHPGELLGWTSGAEKIGRNPCIHFIIFTLLGFLTELARPRLKWWITVVLLFAYSFSTELLQILTGRRFEWIDVGENFLGLCAGLLLGFIITRITVKNT